MLPHHKFISHTSDSKLEKFFESNSSSSNFYIRTVPINLLIFYLAALIFFFFNESNSFHSALHIIFQNSRKPSTYILKMISIYTNLTKVRWRTESYGKNNFLTRFPKFTLYFSPERIFQKI